MIHLRNIHKRFGSLEVIKGVDLLVNSGEILGIVGASGAGKTTLLQIMGTLCRPDSGEVLYNDVRVDSLSASKLARFRNSSIGFVFQFHQLLPEFTLLENVAMPALIGGTSRKEAFAKASRLIGYLGLDDRVEHKPAQLSGGECQRAAVARALINDPAVVLADEPSGSLDSHNRRELHRLISDLRRDMNQTFVIVTHDEHLASTCDRIVRMADGKITEIESIHSAR